MTEAPAESPIPTYDFSGLPAGKGTQSEAQQSPVARMLLLALMSIGGLLVAFLGAFVAAIGAREVAKATASSADLASLTTPEPAGLPDLLIVEVGRTMEVLGALVCAAGIALAVWNALRPRTLAASEK